MDWNDRYQIEDTPWDKGAPTPVLTEIAAQHPGIFSGKTIVPGCGLGYDARWLATKGCQVTGSDIAPLAIERARKLDPENTVDFQLGDFLNPPADAPSSFDFVFEHTCFCAIDPALRPAYIKAAHTLLKSGGHLIGVFFTDPEMEDGETGPPFGIDPISLKSLWQQASFQILHTWTPTTGYPGRIGREFVLILKKQS